MNCPDDEQLENFLDGRLPEEFCSRLENHLHSCLACQKKLPGLNQATSSIVTSFQFDDGSRFEFLDEPGCIELQEFAYGLPDRSETPGQHSTIVVDPSDVNTGIPNSIGRYQVIRHLGAGSFGAVYLARDAQLDRHVAVKVSHATRILSPADAERFQSEAKLLAKMEHPNIVPVYDSGLTEEGLVYIVFRFIRGSNLAEMMQPERFPLEKSIELTCIVASALHYMHTHGIVHRDIKPANILIDQSGVPFLTDFGLAVRSDEIVQGREVVGTLAYMSPEQLSGDGHLVGPRSDIFSLGVLLFELLTGQRPFNNRKPDHSISWMIEAPSPCDFDKTLPLAIGRICQKALQNRSADRFSSAKEFARELQASFGESTEKIEGRDAKPVYRGLRAFHREDQEFFCELLPGLRSRQGNPESVQFWINRIRGVEGEAQPRIGVIYGNTGSGKSSLVNAAILPELTDEVTVISVQASSSRTESDLAKSLKKVFIGAEEVDSLTDICRQVRMRTPPFANQRILIVIDQFEQWLHGRSIDLTVELVQALRQCDGESIQCLLIVRDDFWVELSKFMRTVEEPMREGENIMAVEPFAVEHAEQVLLKIGKAVKKDDIDEDSHRSFVRRGVELIQTDGTVPPVRLALFVEITKELPWKAETIRHFDDLTVLAQTYIKQRFDPELCPRRYRTHTTAMKSVLGALLPERGADLKGQGRSLKELKTICGYENSPERFRQMIDLMDRDLRIISPVQENETEESDDLSYQLTHDYLVPAIRSWIDEEELRTFRGRAKLKLRERASLWGLKGEFRQLPGILEVLQILAGTSISEWSTDQSRVMKAAMKFHAAKAVIVTLLFILLGGFLYTQSMIASDRTLIDQLSQASYERLPQLLDRIEERRPDIEPLIEESLNDSNVDSELETRLQLAKLSFDKSVVDKLKNDLLVAEVEKFQVIADDLLEQNVDFGEFQNLLIDEAVSTGAKFRAASVLLASHQKTGLAEEEIAPIIIELAASGLVRRSDSELSKWSNWLFPQREILIPQLKEIYCAETSSNLPLKAAMILSDYLKSYPQEYVGLILKANHQQLLAMCGNELSPRRDLQQQLAGELQARLPELDEKQFSERVNAISALAHLNRFDTIAEFLDRHANPTLRYILIDKLTKSRCDPRYPLQYLSHTEEAGVIAALLLVLGSYDHSIFNDSLLDEIRSKALRIYQSHPDAEVHAAAKWLLRQFGESPTLPTTNDRDADQNWLIDSAGFTMVIPRAEHRNLSHSPAKPKIDIAIDWEYAISATEVTVREYIRFDPDYKIHSSLQESLDCPVSRVKFETAMLYCNWLSREAGFGEESLCYEVRGDRVRAKEDIVKLKGYRLPLNIEWEAATRAKSVTSYPFGTRTDVINQFAWHAAIADGKLHPVGELKPNQLGLFDVCGNVSEWCHNKTSLERKSGKWHSNSSVPYRGGSIYSFSTSARPHGSMHSGDSPEQSRADGFAQIGFRIARTLTLPED